MSTPSAVLLAFLLVNSISANVAPETVSPTQAPPPCSFDVTQGSLDYPVEPVENSNDVVSFYDYYSASAHTSYVEAYVSVLYLYLDTSASSMYLVFHFNIDEGGSPDAITTVGIQGIPAGATAVVSDDPGPGSNAEFYMSRYPQGQFHYFTNTDGGALGPLPMDTEWSMKINVSHSGPDPMRDQKWVNGTGTRLPLAMTGTIVVASVCNEAPTPTAGGPYAGAEGSPITLNAGGSTDPDGDPLTYRWDFDSDGTYDTGWSSSPTATHTWGDDWSGKATVEVSDGKLTAKANASVVVLNVAPAIAFTIIPSGNEGDSLAFEARIIDPGSDDLSVAWSGSCTGWSSPTVYPNDPAHYPDPHPSPDVHPRNVTDVQTVACGDNAVYAWSLKVEDDDGGTTTLTGTFSVANVRPFYGYTYCPQIVGCNSTRFEGALTDYWVSASDAGSDDLRFPWTWGDGTPSESATYYNNGLGPDPPSSPYGIFPFSAGDNRSHAFGDDGTYRISVATEDDDGGVAPVDANVTIVNLPPSLVVQPLQSASVDEATQVTLDATATDPGSDDLTFTWKWDYGPTESATFYNDGLGPDPPRSPGGTFPFTASSSSTHTYGDDCSCEVELTVADDDGGTITYTTTVNVLNLPPSVAGDIEVKAEGSLVLRVAGEKWHDVTATIYLNGAEKYSASVVRTPGSPDDQAAVLGNVTLDLMSSDVWSALVVYTPPDDPINGQVWGANPAWLVFTAEDGSKGMIHHTFNVRHNDTWVWIVDDLRSALAGVNLTFNATATDPGSDDLTFAWDWGDGSPPTATTCYNDGVGPDPYPSPGGTYPFTAMDMQNHAYGAVGAYSVVLSVTDDDGGVKEMLIVVIII